MIIARVIGSLWATQKNESTTGTKFLIVQPYNLDKTPKPDTIVVADMLGAGEGELVMVAHGRAARLAVGNEDMTIEAAVIAIIDEYEINPEHYRGDLDPERVSFKKSLQ